jgi:hypothetical protein
MRGLVWVTLLWHQGFADSPEKIDEDERLGDVLGLNTIVDEFKEVAKDYYTRIDGPSPDEAEKIIDLAVKVFAKKGDLGLIASHLKPLNEVMRQILSFEPEFVGFESIVYEPMHRAMRGMRVAAREPATSILSRQALADRSKVFDIHKSSAAQVGFYLYFTGIESFFGAMKPSFASQKRILTVEFIETNLFQILFSSGGLRHRYREYTDADYDVDLYNPDLLVIEDWLAAGVPDDPGKRAKALVIFRDLLGFKDDVWEKSSELISRTVKDQMIQKLAPYAERVIELQSSN